MVKRKRSGSQCYSESELSHVQSNSAEEISKDAETDLDLDAHLKYKVKAAKVSDVTSTVESEEVGGHHLRASARQAKKCKADISQDEALAVSTNVTVDDQEIANNQDSKKQKRQWELWSIEDKEAFFEALNEHGKDFESIQNYIAIKSKKKSGSSQHITMKNRDQVRHFYYRTWHKISKYLSISDDVKKSTQELYGLINYGELRRKLSGHLDKKSGTKLNELVHKGVTVIRYKGKNLRIRTPICRALKTINKLNDGSIDENWKLPPFIVAELWPKSNAAWVFVQSASQNPRLRGKFSLNTRISSLIKYLERKWQTAKSRYLQNVLSSVQSPNNLPSFQEPKLHLYLRDDTRIVLFSLKAAEMIQSSQLSLKSHKQSVMKDRTIRLGLDGLVGVKKTEQPDLKIAGCIPDSDIVDRTETPEITQKVEASNVELNTECYERLDSNSTVSFNCSGTPGIEIKIECESQDSQEVMHDFTLRQLKALETAANPHFNIDPEVEFVGERAVFVPKSISTSKDDLVKKSVYSKDFNADSEVPTCEVTGKVISAKFQGELPLQNNGTASMCDQVSEEERSIRNGWTAATADSLTLGELYLMVDRPDELCFLYEWDYPPEAIPDNAKEETELVNLSERRSNADSNFGSVTDILDKLVELSRTLFQVDKKRTNSSCHMCGHIHICGKSSDKSTDNSKPSSTKSNRTVKVKQLCQSVQVNLEADKSVTKDFSKVNRGSHNVSYNPGDTPSSKADKIVFRVPESVTSQSKPTPKDSDALQRIQNIVLPPFSNRGPKNRSKNVVVQRVLPLLPRQQPLAPGKFTLKVGIPRPSSAVNKISRILALEVFHCSQCPSSPSILCLPLIPLL